VVVWAPAKVNLYLEVLGKRPDGYHAIETLMVTVGLFDTLVCAMARPHRGAWLHRSSLSAGGDTW